MKTTKPLRDRIRRQPAICSTSRSDPPSTKIPTSSATACVFAPRSRKPGLHILAAGSFAFNRRTYGDFSLSFDTHVIARPDRWIRPLGHLDAHRVCPTNPLPPLPKLQPHRTGALRILPKWPHEGRLISQLPSRQSSFLSTQQPCSRDPSSPSWTHPRGLLPTIKQHNHTSRAPLRHTLQKRATSSTSFS